MISLKQGLEGILITFLIGGVIFASSNKFVEESTLLKVYSFLLFSSILGSASLINNRKLIQISQLTVFFCVILLYLIVSSFSISPNPRYVFSLISFLYLYFYLCRRSLTDHTINIILITFCFLEALYGLLQYFHIIHSASSFLILGSYNNPAGYAICLVMVFPIILTYIREDKVCKVICFFIISIFTLGIILSESRAAIISLLVISLIFLSNSLSHFFKRYKKSILSCLALTSIIVFVGLFLIKRDSALGRLLIWEVSCNMIKDNLIFGGGNGFFLAEYMRYQAEYFSSNPNSNYSLLANNVFHPFNEYLLFVIEHGIIAFIFLITFVFFIFKSNKLSSPYILSLISLGIFSCFSYPFKYPFVWFMVAYCLSQTDINKNSTYRIKFKLNIWFNIFMILVCSSIFVFTIRDFKFEYDWNKVAKYSLLVQSKKMIINYDNLYHSWNGNHLFLYNYGTELNHNREYERSLIVFNQCTQYWNDYDIQIMIADNYFNLKEWVFAEKHYKLASYMCPNRFVPLEQLVYLYDQIGASEKADKLAILIINKEEKVPSSRITLIKNKMRKRMSLKK